MDITPTPTDEEVAAIVAAVEMSWPRGSSEVNAETSPRWRFSGRWWNQTPALARRRPRTH